MMLLEAPAVIHLLPSRVASTQPNVFNKSFTEIVCDATYNYFCSPGLLPFIDVHTLYKENGGSVVCECA